MSRRTVVPARVVPEAVLGAVAVTVPPDGVVLGRDGSGAPVLARLLRPAPVRVTLVGGWWAAQVLVHRLLAHGVTLHVHALADGDPNRHYALAGVSEWLGLGHLAGTGRVRTAGDGLLWADVDHPVVLLHDTGPAPAPAPPGGPWQTGLTVLTRVGPADHALVAASDVVLAQRLDASEAAVLAEALRLPADFPARAGGLHHEMVAVCRAGSVRYVWLTPTTMEHEVFG